MKPMEQRVLLGGVVGGGALFVGIIISVIQVPVLLSLWDAELYGKWLSLFSYLAILTALDLGHQNYLGNLFNKLWIENPVALRSALASGIRAALLIGILEFIAGCVGLFSWAIVHPVSFWGTFTSADVYAALIYLGYWTLLGSVGGILVKLYLPKGLYVRSIIWGILARILNFLSLVAAASLSQSTCVAMFFVCVFGALLNVALFLDIYREFESILPSWGDGSWNEGWRNFVKSLVLTVNAIGEQLSGNGVLILISRTFPVAQVAVFSSIKTISNVAFQGASVLGQPFSPDFARFIVKREAVKLLDSFHALWFVLGGLMVFFFSIAAPFVEPLYSLWTRNKLVFEPGLFVALILAVALRVISLPVVQCLISVNQLPSQTWMTWTRAFVSLGLSALTLPYYGLVGVGIGLAVGEFFGGFCVPAFYATRMLRAMGAKFSFLELWGPMSHIVVIGVVAYSATFTHVLPSIVSGGGGVVGILIAIFQWKSLSFDMRSRFVSLIFNNFHVLTRYKFAGQEHY